MRYLLVITVLLSGCGGEGESTPGAAPHQDAGLPDTAAQADAAPEVGADVRPDVVSPGCESGSATEQLARLDVGYCAPLGDAICEATVDCGCGELEGFPDAAACRAFWRGKCLNSAEDLRPAFDSGELQFCDELAAECVEAVRAANDACRAGPPPGTVPLSCVLMLTSNTALEQPCGVVGLGCAEGQGLCGSAGICSLPPGPGDVCEGVCADGFLCDSEGVCVTGEQGDNCVSERDCQLPLACVEGACGAPRGPDEPCTADTDCHPGLACVSDSCAPVLAPCIDPSACGDNAACVASQARVCEPLSQLGQPCTNSGDCMPDGWCEAGTCAARPGAGAPCADGVYCGEGLACVFATGECDDMPEDGEPCALGEMGPFVCGEEQACVSGLCAPVPSEGEACGDGNNACADELGCQFNTDGTSVCVPEVGVGEPCTNDTQCEPGTYCEFSSMTCAQVADAGEPCEDGNECGPQGSCVPSSSGSFVCVEMPVLGQQCFLECGPGAVCRAVAKSGTCAAPVCGLIAY